MTELNGYNVEDVGALKKAYEEFGQTSEQIAKSFHNLALDTKNKELKKLFNKSAQFVYLTNKQIREFVRVQEQIQFILKDLNDNNGGNK